MEDELSEARERYEVLREKLGSFHYPLAELDDNFIVGVPLTIMEITDLIIFMDMWLDDGGRD